MMNFFRNNEQATFSAQQPEALELNEQDLEQATGGCGHCDYRRHRRYHREYRHDHHGNIIIVIVED